MAAAYSARGASGFGAAAAMPLLGLVIPLKLLVPAWTVIGIAAGAALLGSDRRNVDWTHIVRLVPGTLIGIALGLVVFTRLSSDALARGLGVFVLLYGCYALWRTFRAGSLHVSQRLAAALGGIGGGITGTVVGTMGSTFYAVYFDAVSLNKDSYRATMTAILMTLTVTRGLGYLLIGEFSMEALYLAAFLLPSMVVGLLIGQRLHHGISEIAHFRPRTVAVALIVSGLALLAK